MRYTVLLYCLLACTPDRPPPVPEPDATALRLHRMPFEVRLPETDAPELPPAQTRISDWLPARFDQSYRLGAAYRAPMPFEVEPEAERFEPLGIALYHGQERLPWRLSTQRGSSEIGYRISRGELILFWPKGAPPPETLTLDHPARRQHLARLHPQTSGLEPADFIDYTHSIGTEHRRGWLLPTGTTLTLDLALYRRAIIDASVALLPESDGPVTITISSLRESENSVEHVIGQRRLTNRDSFQTWTMTLDSYDTGSHTLQIRAEGPSEGGLAFIGHPTLHPPGRVEVPRRVVWVSLDTTRRDHLGLYGYEPRFTPNLDRWSEQATVFTNVIAPAPSTRPSVRSALTGRRPLDAVGAPSIFTLLDRAGFATGGIVANPHLSPRFGFADGADYWLIDDGARAEDQIDRALGWLRSHADHEAILFVQLMDPHLPYGAPEPYFERFTSDRDPYLSARLNRESILDRMRDDSLSSAHKEQLMARYAGEIAYLDQHLNRLFYAIENLPGPSLVILHSDHGEELWDRGGFEHGHSLHRELIDAALVMKIPGKAEGTRIDHPVELADLVPTTLDLLLVSADEPVDGQSLRPLLRGDPVEVRPRGMAHTRYGSERWGVRAEGHTYILHTLSGREELYNLADDPHEREELVSAGVDPARFRPLLAQAHGVDVSPGWRVEVQLGTEPIDIELPVPATRAGVIDPEAGRSQRANQVWGEQPPVLPSDIASVELLEQATKLRVTPSEHGSGTLYVMFDEPTPATGGVWLGKRVEALHDRGPIQLSREVSVAVRTGPVLYRPPGEAVRIAARTGWTELLPESQRAALAELDKAAP